MMSDSELVGSSVCQNSSLERMAMASVLFSHLHRHLLSPQAWLNSVKHRVTSAQSDCRLRVFNNSLSQSGLQGNYKPKMLVPWGFNSRSKIRRKKSCTYSNLHLPNLWCVCTHEILRSHLALLTVAYCNCNMQSILLINMKNNISSLKGAASLMVCAVNRTYHAKDLKVNQT